MWQYNDTAGNGNRKRKAIISYSPSIPFWLSALREWLQLGRPSPISPNKYFTTPQIAKYWNTLDIWSNQRRPWSKEYKVGRILYFVVSQLATTGRGTTLFQIYFNVNIQMLNCSRYINTELSFGVPPISIINAASCGWPSHTVDKLYRN